MIGKKLDQLIAGISRKNEGKSLTGYRSYSVILPGSKKLCLLLPPWHIARPLWNQIQNRLLEQGYSLVVVEAAEDVLSDDPARIVSNYRKVRSLALDAVKEIQQQYDFGTLDVIGLSLGTSSALHVAVSGMPINKLILVSPADDLAEGIWEGLRTKHIRESLESKKVTLLYFQEEMKELTMRQKHQIKVEEVFIHASEADTVIPYKLALNLKEIFHGYGIPVTLKTNKRLGHYLTFIQFCLSVKI